MKTDTDKHREVIRQMNTRPAATPETDGCFARRGISNPLAASGGGFVPIDFARELEHKLTITRKVADELAESVYRIGTTMCGCDNCNAYIKAQYALTTYENLPHMKTTKPTE